MHKELIRNFTTFHILIKQNHEKPNIKQKMQSKQLTLSGTGLKSKGFNDLLSGRSCLLSVGDEILVSGVE